MAVLLPHGAFLKEDRLLFTPGTAEPLGVSPPEAVDLHLIKCRTTGPRACDAVRGIALGRRHPLGVRRPCGFLVQGNALPLFRGVQWTRRELAVQLNTGVLSHLPLFLESPTIHSLQECSISKP